ncbi:hypothetical protein KJ693_03905 [bacterium]|nr:hypothetical protein [bacterium]MBU1614438.1 hypothetical protein [bacterium]
MEMVKIKFKDKEADAKGLCGLAKRMKVVCLPDDVYEISSRGLKILDTLNIDYQILKKEGFDYAYSAIRNSVASQV